MPASSQDFIGGFDPTSASNITGADMLALIQSGTPYTDKGLVLVTTDDNATPPNPDVPNADASVMGHDTKFQRYLWIRRLVSSAIAYVWNPAASLDGVYQRWQQINLSAIADYSITNPKIYPGAVTDDKITSVSYTKVIGAPTSLPPSGNATGDLTGTYPAPTILANAVTRTKLQSDAVVDANRAVGADHIQNGVVDATRHLKVGGSAFQIPIINAAANNWAYTAIPILQFVAKAVTTGDSTATILPADGTIPQITEGKEYISQALTVLRSTSLIRVRFSCNVSAHTTIGVAIALFEASSANAKQASNVNINPIDTSAILVLDYIMAAPAAGTVMTWSVRFGPVVAGTAYANSINTSGQLFGAASNSVISIEEIEGTLH